jgi:hypothetical protein
VMKLGRLEVVGCGRGVRLRRFPRRFPFQIDLLFDNSASAFYAVVLYCAMQLDRRSGIRLDCAFDLAILESALEGVVPEFAGEFGSVELELQAAVIGLIKKLEDRNPLSCGRRLGEDCPGKQEQTNATTHARYDIRLEFRQIVGCVSLRVRLTPATAGAGCDIVTKIDANSAKVFDPARI